MPDEPEMGIRFQYEMSLRWRVGKEGILLVNDHQDAEASCGTSCGRCRCAGARQRSAGLEGHRSKRFGSGELRVVLIARPPLKRCSQASAPDPAVLDGVFSPARAKRL